MNAWTPHHRETLRFTDESGSTVEVVDATGGGGPAVRVTVAGSHVRLSVPAVKAIAEYADAIAQAAIDASLYHDND